MTEAHIWKEFPEINRKVEVYAGYHSHTAAGLGCHCGSISSVSAYLMSPYGLGTDIPGVQIIKPTKDDPAVKCIRQTSGPYAGYWGLAPEEMDKINSYLKKEKITFDSFSPEFCGSIVKLCEKVPIWVLSDAINASSPARNSGATSRDDTLKSSAVLQLGSRNDGLNNTVIGRTSVFADYLIRNKVGYIFESPIVQNPLHRHWGGYSLNRVWLWIPPNHLDRTLGVTAQYGQEKFPDLDSWKKIIFSDLQVSSKPISSYYTAMDKAITEKTVDQVVFDGGVFPDEKRFTRNTKEA